MSEAEPIRIERWPTEEPLLAFNVIAALGMWVVIVVSIIGLVYAAILAVFFGLMHLVFVAHVRGNGVRLSPNQFPELYASVTRMAARMELWPVPETYVMQAGGALNAFATRFLRSNIVVLFSDLLEACGDNTAARDMIIAHELGHIKAGHLRWRWFLLPGAFVPFLGSALSRAREYTCDRYGLAGAGDKNGAALGLAILAAGATHGPLVNKAELVRQRSAISRSGLMTLGEWFSSHPPLAKRIAEIDPSLAADAPLSRGGELRAVSMIAAVPVILLLPIVGIMSIGLGERLKKFAESASVQQAGTPSARADDEQWTAPPDAMQRARADLLRLAAFIEGEGRRGSIPWNMSDLKRRLREQYPRAEMPVDPFDGSDYGYDQRGQHFLLWSSGPDGESWTSDDVRYDSRLKQLTIPGAAPSSLNRR